MKEYALYNDDEFIIEEEINEPKKAICGRGGK